MFSVTAKDDRGIFGGLSSRLFSVTVKPRAYALSEYGAITCSPLVGVSHTITADTSTMGNAFYYSKEILDSASQSLSGNSPLWFSSSGNVFSTSRRDSILGDTTGVFIIKNTVSNLPYNCPYTYYDTLLLELSTYDFLPLADTIIICDKSGDSIRLQDSWEHVLWSTGDSLSVIYIDSAGAYSVALTDYCGNRFTRYFQVAFELTPQVDFRDTLMCRGDSLLFVYPDTLFHTILWSNGYQGDSLWTTRDGGYYVDISNHCGALRDTFMIYENISDAHIEQVYAACDTVMLRPVIDFGSDVETYWIMNRDTIADSVLLVGRDADIHLYAKTRCIEERQDYKTVRPLTVPDIKIARDFKFSCVPESTPFTAAGRYVSNALWSTGDTGSATSVSSFGTYVVSSENVCGLAMILLGICRM